MTVGSAAPVPGPDRRGFILGAAGAFLIGGNAVADARTDQRLDLGDPADSLTAMLRMQGRLDGQDAPWWYFGRIYGVVGETAPRLLVRFEGLEIMRLTAIAGNEYAATGVTTSFFQSPGTKEVLSVFSNPYTGKANDVTPNMIGGTGRPAAFFSTRGVRPGRVQREDWPSTGLSLTWDYYEDLVWMSHDRVYPPGMPQPMGESSVARARIADLHDLDRAFVPAGFSSTYFAPWPKWMQMDGQPGHVVWHADGVKLQSAAKIPPAFLERMQKQFPERLAAPAYQPA